MLNKLPQELINKVFTYLSIQDCKVCANLLADRSITRRMVMLNRQVLKLVLEKDCDDADLSDDDYPPDFSVEQIGKQKVKANELKELREKLINGYDDRTSAITYLGQYFPSSTNLLKSMIKHDVIISGSRAVEYFAGVSTDTNSDWDFYINNDFSNILYFMEDMKSNGVRWLSSVESIQNRVENDKELPIITTDEIHFAYNQLHSCYAEDYVKLNITKLRDHASNIDINADDRLSAKEYKKIYGVTLQRKDGQTKKVLTEVGDYYLGENISVVTGILNYNGSSTELQLVIAPYRSLLEVITTFYSTIVQCVITGSMAIHMYAQDVYTRQGYIWDTEYSHTPIGKERTEHSINKYIRRGYKLSSKSKLSTKDRYVLDRQVKRIIGDSKCDVITFDRLLSSFSYNERLEAKSKRQQYFNFTWLQLKDHLRSDFYTVDCEYQKCRSIAYLFNNEDQDKFNELEEILGVGRNRNKESAYGTLKDNHYTWYCTVEPIASLVKHFLQVHRL